MPKDARRVAKGLKKKGFFTDQGDHTFYHLCVNGKKTVVYTKISHGEDEIHDELLGKMARQVGLNKRDFIDLIDCPLSFEDYLKRLRAAGKIDP